MENPLYSVQREKAGADTLSKYFYQYNWALCEVLNKHARQEEYVVFMEMHEDVVFSDSLKNDGNFDFYQIKNTKSKTLKALTTTTKKNKNSVIGKCILSVHNKAYSKKVKSLNLVISQGFSFKEHLIHSTKLKVIKTSDLKTKSLTNLSNLIKAEIGEEIDISALRFMSSDLSYDSPEALEMQLIGNTAKVLSQLFPNTTNNSENSYRVLIDDLLRKGKCTYDFREWEEFIEHKGLTSEQVHVVLTSNTSTGFKEILEVFNDISDDLGIKNIHKASMRIKLERFHSEIIFNKASQCINAVETVNNLFNKVSFKIEEISNLTIEEVSKNLNLNNVEIQTVIIYCIIQRVLDSYEQ